MRGQLREYVMPDGQTRQFWDCDVPEGAVPLKAEKPKEDAPKAAPSKTRKKAAK